MAIFCVFLQFFFFLKMPNNWRNNPVIWSHCSPELRLILTRTVQVGGGQPQTWGENVRGTNLSNNFVGHLAYLFHFIGSSFWQKKEVFNCWWSNPFSLLSLFDRKIGFFYRGRFGVVTMLWPLMGSLDHSYIQQPSLSFLSFATFLIYNWFSLPFP